MSDPAQRSSITLADGRSLDVCARGLRFVASSRPGYGSSSRQQGRMVADAAGDARAPLDGLGIDRAWVVGWSGGGPHALACGNGRRECR